MNRKQIEDMLTKNDSLFSHLHVINQKFDIIPSHNHYGMSINYIDTQESRFQFIRELVNTIIEWVYSKSKQSELIERLSAEGRSISNSWSELLNSAFMKFRPPEDGSLLHGQYGELLLSNCIQRFFGAVPILRKMPITTSPGHERFGADAIHYKCDEKNHTFYLGEAKSYTSDYQFNTAFEKSISSILFTYQNITKEIYLYLHEDFLEKELQNVASNFINGKLHGTRIHLVSMIAYNETKQITADTEDKIKKCIDEIICDRYSKFDNAKIDIQNHTILNRITYIVFPIWEFSSLLDDFARYLRQ